MAGFVKMATTRDIASGTMQTVEVNGPQLILADVAGTFFALDAACLQQSAPLIQGGLRETVIECPQHHYRYDVQSGKNLYPAMFTPLTSPTCRRTCSLCAAIQLGLKDTTFLSKDKDCQRIRIAKV